MRRRAYKIRDVFEEMDLNGVAPCAMTFFRAMFACMKVGGAPHVPRVSRETLCMLCSVPTAGSWP